MSALPSNSVAPLPVGTGPLVSTKEVADQLAISERSLLRMVEKGGFPVGIRVGRCWRWPAETITQWIASKAAGMKGGAK